MCYRTFQFLLGSPFLTRLKRSLIISRLHDVLILSSLCVELMTRKDYKRNSPWTREIRQGHSHVPESVRYMSTMGDPNLWMGYNFCKLITRRRPLAVALPSKHRRHTDVNNHHLSTGWSSWCEKVICIDAQDSIFKRNGWWSRIIKDVCEL